MSRYFVLLSLLIQLPLLPQLLRLSELTLHHFEPLLNDGFRGVGPIREFQLYDPQPCLDDHLLVVGALTSPHKQVASVVLQVLKQFIMLCGRGRILAYLDGLLHYGVHWGTHNEEPEALVVHFGRSIVHLQS